MAWAARIYDNRLAVFYASGAIGLLLLVTGLLTDFPYAGLAAFALAGLLLILLDFGAVFYLLLLVLPLSNEVALTPGLRLYLPTEPLAMALLGCGTVFLLLNPRLLRAPFWKHPLTLLVLVHLAWIAYATVSSTHPLVSLKYLAAKTWFLGAYFFAAAYLLREHSTVRKLVWLLFVPTLAGMVYVLIRHGATGFLFDEVNAVVRPIYRNHVNYGVWITAMLPLLFLARSWYRGDTLGRLLFNLAILVNLAAIYFSYTRGAWVALMTLPFFMFAVRYRLTRQFTGLALAAGIAVVVLLFQDNRYLHYSPEFESTIYHEEFSEHMAATFEMRDMSTVERFYRWIAAIQMFGERPFTGFGPGNFVNNYKTFTVSAWETWISDNEEGSSVHNYFLTMLTEQGIPGLLIFIALIAVAVYHFEKVYHRQTHAAGRRLVMALGCCFMVLLVNNFFSDLLEADKTGPLFFLCLALLIRLDQGMVVPEEQSGPDFPKGIYR